MAEAAGLSDAAAPRRRFRPALLVLVVPWRLLVRGAEHGWFVVAGRLLLLLATLLVLFMAFELFLTPFFESRAQDSMLTSFNKEIVSKNLDRPTEAPAEGSPVAILEIPRIGVTQVVAEGTTPSDLKSGPGHLRAAPLPGEFGNSVIAGRRTTYGAPFSKLYVLAKGDTIRTVTGQGLFTYAVSSVKHVVPGQADPVTAAADSRLTLITSDPAYLANGRLAVVAKLKGAPAAVAHRPPALVGKDELGLAGDSLGLALGIIFGELLLVVLFVAWRQRKRWPAAVIYFVGAPLALALMLLTFFSLDLLLPGTL